MFDPEWHSHATGHGFFFLVSGSFFSCPLGFSCRFCPAPIAPPKKVADEILKFRRPAGDLGTLVYAGKDWRVMTLAKRSMTLREVNARHSTASSACFRLLRLNFGRV